MSDVIGLGERYRQMFNAHAIATGSGPQWPGLDDEDDLLYYIEDDDARAIIRLEFYWEYY